ncbi:hypothetical protein D3C75_966990 [compost metagenome]
MHAFMPAILLRSARCDALGNDAQTQPPDRQLGKTCASFAGERYAVVGSDTLRQPIFTEYISEYRLRFQEVRVCHAVTGKQEATGVIHDRQRIAPDAGPCEELALVVCTEQLIGRLRFFQWLGIDGHTLT